MKITPIEIKSKEFTKSLRGFDADEVNNFLEKIATVLEDLMNENEGLMDEISELKKSLDGYKRIEKDLQSKLLKAQDSSAKSIESAKEQTGMMLKESELKAARIIEKAKENANEIRNAVINLREEKNLIIANLKAIVNTQSTLLEGKVKKIDEVQHEQEKTKSQLKDDLDLDVDDIVNKIL